MRVNLCCFFGLLFNIISCKEFHIPRYNYCGPGTNFNNRRYFNDPPFNQLDTCCYYHDKSYFYNRYNNHKKKRKKYIIADIQFVLCVKNVYYTTPSMYEQFWCSFCEQVFRAKLFWFQLL
jgi:hypothetical protein